MDGIIRWVGQGVGGCVAWGGWIGRVMMGGGV